MDLHAWHWGAQSPERIVFLHGLGGTGRIWRSIAIDLEKDFEIVAPDQRGHGRSRPIPDTEGKDPLETHSPNAYAQDVIDFVAKHQIGPFVLVGHSMGGRNSASLAAMRPDLVRGLITIDIGWHDPRKGVLSKFLGPFIEQLPHTFPSRKEAKAFLDERAPERSVARFLLSVCEMQEDGSIGFPFERQSLIHTLRAGRADRLREQIKTFAQTGKPVLALRGGISRVWEKPDYEEEREIFKDIPNVVFEEVEGASHGLPFEKRKEFAERVRLFTKDC